VNVSSLVRSPLAFVAALVCAVNLAALGHAAYNRRGIEADVTMTSRELRYENPGDESTVMTLRIMWVQEDPLMFRRDAVERAGFDCHIAPDAPDAARFYGRQPQRQVYVALEYDGPAWQRHRAAQEETLKQLGPSGRAPLMGTRLVTVDVDTDPAALRQRYPDRARYVISRARMQVHVSRTAEPRPRPIVVGLIRQLIPSVINVPRPLSGHLRDLMRNANARANLGADDPRYRVTLRYGRLHEPWVLGVHP
jgi:hypothetical protein